MPSQAPYIEPLPLKGYIFGPDFILDFNGSHFTAIWPHFVISEADNLLRLGNDVLNPSVVYPVVGNLVDKGYMVSLPDAAILANWHPFSVCGYPHFPAYFISDDPTAMTHGTSFTIAMPHTVDLGSYLCQSDAEHPPNVSFLVIVEDSESGVPPRYRVNAADLFFKTRYEPPPGTILYADVSAFLEFIMWTPDYFQARRDSSGLAGHDCVFGYRD